MSEGKRVFIGITGPMQSGKDTLAEAIALALPVEWRTPPFHFADPLKEMTQALLGGSVANYWGKDADKQARIPFWSDNLPQFATYRIALQWIGTDLFRNHVHPDFWILAMSWRIAGHLEKYPKQDMAFIFPDVRFANEAKFIRAQGGIIVRVSRADGATIQHGIAGHASEQGLNEDLITHRFAIGKNGHAHVAKIIVDQVLGMADE
jgi:hypothetical protein